MAENIRMDSHKLIYHPETVSRWLKGENIYPIEMEIGLTNACNHRCIFCAVDYINTSQNYTEDIKNQLLSHGVCADNMFEYKRKGYWLNSARKKNVLDLYL